MRLVTVNAGSSSLRIDVVEGLQRQALSLAIEGAAAMERAGLPR